MSTSRDPTGPFRFLTKTVKNDLASAFEFEARLGGPQRCLAELASDANARTGRDVDSILTYLRDSRPTRRIIALSLLEDLVTSMPDLIPRVFSCAFVDSEPAVRGFAWRIIAYLWWRDDPTGTLVEVARRVLVERFELSPDRASDLVAIAWLDGVAGFCQTIKSVKRAGGRRRLADEFRERVIRQKAGEDWRRLEAAPEAFLQHADPRRRSAALMTLCKNRVATESIERDVVRIIHSDEDPGVRIAGIIYLVETHRRSQDVRTARLLAQIVVDQSNPIQVREIAYQGIYQVLDMPVSDWPETKAAVGQFKFPADIDWELLRVCLEG